MSTIKSSSENLTLNADGANNDIKFQSNGAEVASIDQAGTIQINGNLKGKSDNTTELGNPYNVGGIKRLRMVQGGEIHFGDTTTSNFFGITEGTVNQFSDADIMSLYFRNRLDLYASNNNKRLRIDGDGIKFNTDTAAANALNDYEEGTWTVVYSGGASAGTYPLTNVKGIYTKIGNLVTVSASAYNVTRSSAGSGDIRILGLPFVVSTSSLPNNTFRGNVGTLELDTFTFTGTSLNCTASAGNSWVNFRTCKTGTADVVLQVGSESASNNADFAFSITYRTDS